MELLISAVGTDKLSDLLIALQSHIGSTICIIIWNTHQWKIPIYYDESIDIIPIEGSWKAPLCYKHIKKDIQLNQILQDKYISFPFRHAKFQNMYIKKFVEFPCFLIFANYEKNIPQLFNNIYFNMTKLALRVHYEKNKAEIRRRNQEKLFSRISHAIRTPIHGILHMNKMIQQEKYPESIRQYVNYLNTSSLSLATNIFDILDLTKLELGILRIKSRIISLNECLSSVLRIVRNKASQKSININLHINNDVPKYIYTDDKRLKQILISLIHESIRQTNSGNINIYISSFLVTDEEVECNENSIYIADSLKTSEQYELSILIQDSSSGYTPDEKLHIFDDDLKLTKALCQKLGGDLRFNADDLEAKIIVMEDKPHQIDNKSLKSIVGKTCIVICSERAKQLNICKHLKQFGMNYLIASSAEEELLFSGTHIDVGIVVIENLKDLLMIQSISSRYPLIAMTLINVPKELFVFILDYTADSFTYRNAIISVINLDTLPLNSNIKILIAEDEFINSFILEKMLHKLKYNQITIVTNGKYAVEEVKKNPAFYDLILMDLQMPQMDGMSAAAEIHNLYINCLNKKPRIIGVTAKLLFDENQKYITEFINKPIDSNELSRIMKSVKQI